MNMGEFLVRAVACQIYFTASISASSTGSDAVTIGFSASRASSSFNAI